MRYSFALPMTMIAVVATTMIILDRSIVTVVEGFSISSRRKTTTAKALIQPFSSPVPAATAVARTIRHHHQSSSPSYIGTRHRHTSISSSILFTVGNCNDLAKIIPKRNRYISQELLAAIRNNKNEKGMKQNRWRKTIRKATNQCTTRFVRCWMKFRRTFLSSFAAILLFWFGTAGTYTPVSHGSSSSVVSSLYSTSSPLSSQVNTDCILSASLDEIVDGYVRGHMFDDDVYDPIESIYREAMDDRMTGRYQKDLQDTAAAVVGGKNVKSIARRDDGAAGEGFSGGLVKTVDFLRRQGLSEIQAIVLLTGTVLIGVPAMLWFAFMSIAVQNKRSLNRLMKDRYGDTYTVDATVKEEEDIELPDEDEDDTDDDDDEEDDDE